MSEKHYLDFLNTNIGDAKYFKWREALWLNQWEIFVLPEEEIAQNIIDTASKMDTIREILGAPIIVTSWYRPDAYNQQIGGAAMSYHRQGLACDFVVRGYRSDVVRELLLDYLDRLDIRMEDLSTPHVHIDLGRVVNKRYFQP